MKIELSLNLDIEVPDGMMESIDQVEDTNVNELLLIVKEAIQPFFPVEIGIRTYHAASLDDVFLCPVCGMEWETSMQLQGHRNAVKDCNSEKFEVILSAHQLKKYFCINLENAGKSKTILLRPARV